jgi:hypothetical protein
MGMRRHLLALGVMAAGAALAAGCQALNEPIYVAAPAALDVSGTDMTGAPNRVQGSVVLRFRQPNATEQSQLDADSTRLGFDVPWLKRDRIHLELLYTVTNLDSKDGTFTVAVDGASEFVKYDETVIGQAFAAANQKTQPLALMAPPPRTLAAKQVYQGTLREDDFIEGSLDLDAMGRWMAPFAAVLINRSDVNRVGLDMVPPNVVIPAMQEIDVTLIAETHMKCEFMVRVRSDDDQLLHDSGDRLFVPTPTVYTPTIAPTP